MYVNLKPFFQMQQSTVALNWIMKILQEQEKNTRVAPMLEDKRENGKLKLTISKNNLDLFIMFRITIIMILRIIRIYHFAHLR